MIDDLLTWLRDKTYPRTGDKFPVPDPITIGGAKAIITRCDVKLPTFDRKGSITIEFITLEPH